MKEKALVNDFWRVCEALDSERRLEILRYLMSVEKTEFPSVNELAAIFGVSCAAMSIHLKKLLQAGLVSSKRAERCVYYRAFATTDDGARVIDAMRSFFSSKPECERMRAVRAYVHALSHARRNAIVRCLDVMPGLPLGDLAVRVGMPPKTADRLLADLDKVRIVDLDRKVAYAACEPEATLLSLTLC